MKTKRIEITMEVTIPDDFTIGETEEWILYALMGRFHSERGTRLWDPKIEVGLHRSMTPRPIFDVGWSRAGEEALQVPIHKERGKTRPAKSVKKKVKS